MKNYQLLATRNLFLRSQF